MISGGLESMSNAPQILMTGRRGQRLGHTKLYDHMFLDGLEDAYTGAAMGTFAQKTADEHGLTREEMDAFAIESLTRAQRAIDEGLNAKEMAPVTIKTRRGEHTVTNDEQPHKANLEKIPQLRPAFAEGGTITPANSSSISDGASALLLASEEAANAHGLTPRARIVAHARNSLAPESFTLAPIGAAEQVLAKAGWSAADGRFVGDQRGIRYGNDADHARPQSGSGLRQCAWRCLCARPPCWIHGFPHYCDTHQRAGALRQKTRRCGAVYRRR